MSHFPLIQSFRFFNVYGEGEEDKVRNGTEASPVSSFIHQQRPMELSKCLRGQRTS